MGKNNDGIIPVTRFIRGYLVYQKVMNKRIQDCYERLGLSDKEYHIYEKNHSLVIEKRDSDNDMIHQAEYLNNVLFLREVARKVGKSLIWVYQELVLNGYGDDISMDSDIYQTSLLAYADVYSFLSNSSQENISSFEDDVILVGNQYEEMFHQRCKKIKKK